MSEEQGARWAARLKGEAARPQTTASGVPVAPLYTPEDLQDLDYARDLGFPGFFPFTRGIYPSMYRGRLWTMREYSGFGTAEETNARYRMLLEHGLTGLSVAFDLPTQIGYDSDDPGVEDEVGRVGVAIDSLADMEVLFSGIALDKISTNFTINTTAGTILALYLATAERQGVRPDRLAGTLQNDPLKEYVARGSWLYPVEPSLRLTTDVIEFCAREAPRFNPISVSSAHMQQAGATPLDATAFAFANALTYIDRVLARGLDIDDFAPRLSFNLGVTGMDLFEEVARFRAARRLWARLVQERYTPEKPESCMLRFYCGNGGNSLTVEEPLNNIVRVAYETLATVLGGAQAVHCSSYDEAYAIPTEQAALVALRTQQILAYETGVARTADPLAGSYYVEALTGAAERAMREVVERVEALGGIGRAIELGFVQRRILEAAHEEERRIQAGEKVVVGANKFRREGPAEEVQIHEADPESVRRQGERTRRVRAERDAGRVARALDAVRAAAASEANTMPAILEAVRAYATVGEIGRALQDVFGTYREPVSIVTLERHTPAVAPLRRDGPPIRILVAKPGLDGHDRGAKTMALVLRDAGMEVIYTGLRNTVDEIVATALQEDVQVVGLSVLSGAHVGLARKVLDGLRARGAKDIRVVLGGTVPKRDVPILEAMGVAAVFPVGTAFEAIVRGIAGLVGSRREDT